MPSRDVTEAGRVKVVVYPVLMILFNTVKVVVLVPRARPIFD